MQIQPTHIIVYDNFGEVIAKIQMEDEAAATVTISYCTNATEWVSIAEAVGQALKTMNLESDK